VQYRAFLKIWKKQERFILQEIKKLSMFKIVLKRNELSDKDRKEIEKAVEKIPGKEKYAETMATIWGATMLRGGKTLNRQLELGISYSLKNKEAIKWLKNKKIFETAPVDSPEWTKARDFLRLSDYRGNIDFTTKEKIKTILEKAANEGWSYQKTSKLIQEQGEAGVFSQRRGEEIAVREIGIAYEEGKKQVMDESCKKNSDREHTKAWSTANDGKVRASHMQNQKQGWIEYDKNFKGTGDSHAPSHEYGCRCATLYRIGPPPKKRLGSSSEFLKNLYAI
jgi:hypothetical protein